MESASLNARSTSLGWFALRLPDRPTSLVATYAAERGIMRLLEVLRPEHVVIPLAADTLRSAVVTLVSRLAETRTIRRPERLAQLLADERIRDVVHIGDRVLLPHFRTDAVDRLAVAIGVAEQPLRLKPDHAVGREQVVILVMAPPEASGDYLQVVASLARALRDPATVDVLIAARSAKDVLEIPEIREMAIHPQLLVRDVMNQQAYRALPDTPVREIIDLMIRHELKVVPVVGDKREILGAVSDRDILRHMLPAITRIGGGEAQSRQQNAALYEAPVREIMSRSVMCVSEDQPLSEVVATMINKDVDRMPVVHSGRLTGFLTRSDVVRKLFTT
jgi:CBS domain-containing protein